MNNNFSNFVIYFVFYANRYIFTTFEEFSLPVPSTLSKLSSFVTDNKNDYTTNACNHIFSIMYLKKYFTLRKNCLSFFAKICTGSV